MKPVRKVILGLSSACLIIAGVTFAYLNSVTETAENTFSSNRNLTLELKEPAWDGYEFGDIYPEGVIPGSQVNPNSTEQTLGILKAKNYYPGDSLNKNPAVKNTSEEESEYIAIKVEYVLVNDDMSEEKLTKKTFNDLYAKTQVQGDDEDGDGINDSFVNISNDSVYDLYLYGTQKKATELKANDYTQKLFDRVLINQNINTEINGKWPNFRIKITAYAIQTVNLTSEQVIQELNALASKH